jgi:5-methylcytosine-specific restriction endonuclease McrA
MAYIKRERRKSPFIRQKPPFEGVVQDKRYWTMEWRRAREAQMRAHPTCAVCDHLGTLVDHIVAVADGGDFWEPTNWQTLCMTCHGRKTAKEARRRRGIGGSENG